MIQERDKTILDQFLEREEQEFIKDPTRRTGYVERISRQICEYPHTQICDFIEIQSLTNMGLKSAYLGLTPKDWDFNGKICLILLPPSITGSANISYREKGKV